MNVLKMSSSNFLEVYDLEMKVWGDNGASLDMIKMRYDIFPEGCIIVTDNDEIVGYASLQKVSRMSCQSWNKQTDYGYIKNTHNDSGHIIYGVGMSGKKNGVSDLIINYAYDRFIKSRECYMIALGSRLPGFSSWKIKNNGDIDTYIRLRRKNGFSVDPELFLYQKHGFEILCEMEDYFPCKESLNYGALVIRR